MYQIEKKKKGNFITKSTTKLDQLNHLETNKIKRIRRNSKKLIISIVI